MYESNRFCLNEMLKAFHVKESRGRRLLDRPSSTQLALLASTAHGFDPLHVEDASGGVCPMKRRARGCGGLSTGQNVQPGYGPHKNESMCPFTRVPFWVPIFDPMPYNELTMAKVLYLGIQFLNQLLEL